MAVGNRFKQGKFVPENVEKYKGNVDKITYRSSWELQVFKFLDNNPNVKFWSSEEIKIPYWDKATNKMRTYYPDIWMEYVTNDGEVVREIVEIKPIAQTRAPNRRHKYHLQETVTFITNQCKWEAAQQFCQQNGMKFRLLTENGIFK